MGVPAEVVFDPVTVERIRERLRQSPCDLAGMPSTRWTLDRLLLALDWVPPRTASGLRRLLRHHGIRLRTGRPRQFSPDPDYATKREALLRILRLVAADPTHLVALFLDEMAYHHWPEPGRTWAAVADPLRAERAGPGERHRKIIGALNAVTGQVTQYHRAHMVASQVVDFLIELRQVYPQATRLYVILDNAPVHHTDLVTACVAALDIELVFLPTYAPWLNPIEKLWSWLRQDVLRLHQKAGHWDQVEGLVADFVAHFAAGSDPLLRRVGLLGEGALAQAIRGISP